MFFKEEWNGKDRKGVKLEEEEVINKDGSGVEWAEVVMNTDRKEVEWETEVINKDGRGVEWNGKK